MIGLIVRLLLPRTQARSSGFESDWDFNFALGITGRAKRNRNQICEASHFSSSPFPASFASTLNIARYSLMARAFSVFLT